MGPERVALRLMALKLAEDSDYELHERTGGWNTQTAWWDHIDLEGGHTLKAYHNKGGWPPLSDTDLYQPTGTIVVKRFDGEVVILRKDADPDPEPPAPITPERTSAIYQPDDKVGF